MCKKIQFIICFIIAFHLASAQDSVLFKINYLPSHQYKQNISMSTRMEMTMKGNDSAINAMKEHGIANPNITNIVKRLSSVTTTGKTNSNGKFLMHMKAMQLSDSTEKPSLVLDAYGYGTTTGLPKFDSLASGTINGGLQKQMLQLINGAMGQIQMPYKKMGIGEEYTKTSPFRLPVPGMNMDMIMTEKYKLLSLNDTIAKFSIYMKYTLNMDLSKEEIKNIKITGSGEGNGIFLYNRKYNFPVEYNLILNFDMANQQINNTPLGMEIHMQMNSNHKTEISEL